MTFASDLGNRFAAAIAALAISAVFMATAMIIPATPSMGLLA